MTNSILLVAGGLVLLGLGGELLVRGAVGMAELQLLTVTCGRAPLKSSVVPIRSVRLRTCAVWVASHWAKRSISAFAPGTGRAAPVTSRKSF